MGAEETALVTTAGSLVDLAGALVVSGHVLWAVWGIVGRKGSDQARLRVAQGVLLALSFSLVGTLLKTLALQTWTQIRAFTFVYLLRLLLKRVFTWEELQIESRLPGAAR